MTTPIKFALWAAAAIAGLTLIFIIVVLLVGMDRRASEADPARERILLDNLDDAYLTEAERVALLRLAELTGCEHALAHYGHQMAAGDQIMYRSYGRHGAPNERFTRLFVCMTPALVRVLEANLDEEHTRGLE